MTSTSSTDLTIRVLVVDADPLLRKIVRRHLESEADFSVVSEVDHVDQLFEAIETTQPDVVLLDLAVPGIEPGSAGRLLDDFPWLRVIVWTQDMPNNLLQSMIFAGAHAFLFKRTALPELPSTIRQVAVGEIVLANQVVPKLYSEILVLHGEVVESGARLAMASESLQQQLREMKDTYRETVKALAAAVELRDEYTGGHIDRVKDYSLAIAEEVAPDLTAEQFVFGYILHDIGKLAVKDNILLKPDKLTDEEYEEVKKHSAEGARFVEGIDFLRPSHALVRHHHERWDGRGYPDGLEGERIPQIARIFSLADTLDAITTDRPYRKALPLDHALDEFGKNAGSQFDPEIVDAVPNIVSKHGAFEQLRKGEVPGRAER